MTDRAGTDVRREMPDRRDTGGRRILVTGSRGLLGSTLIPFLVASGHEITRLVRPHAQGSATPPPGPEPTLIPLSPPAGGREATLVWDPAAGTLETAPMEGFDAVIHLAGESIAAGRWTPDVKDRILRSRVVGTHLLAERLGSLRNPPEVLVCASAIGFYGSRGDSLTDESAGPGDGFLASVVQAWEEAADPARAAGVRVVHLRIGIVLTPRGGVLGRMLPAFRLGLGARMGGGRQYLSWIAIPDLLRVFAWVLAERPLFGPVNATAPEPVTNAEFTRALARALGRPAWFAVPAWALRLGLGEMADQMLLTGARAIPARLLASGFEFEHPQLEPALRHLLGRTGG